MHTTPHTAEAKKKISINNAKVWLGKTEEQTPKWRGDNVKPRSIYMRTHRWVYRTLGNPNLCNECATLDAKKYEWANISGEYKREPSDWVRLCTSCHHKMDGHRFKQWQTMRTAQ